MIFFPNCKINLGLRILRKRSDGYHDLETVFYPVALQDALEIVHHPSPATNAEFSSSGLAVDGNLSDNSCVKAYTLLKKSFPQLPAVKMHLHKTIPLGAGLGGGSADGAFTLLLLNKKFSLGMTEEQLRQAALELGSDCPFFVRNRPCLATGRGEIMESLALDLSAYKIVLVNPGIHVNTGWAFSQLRPYEGGAPVKELIALPVDTWKDRLINDFEEPVFRQYPAIVAIQQSLYAKGAVYAALSGSGSTVFGLFPVHAEPDLSFPADYFVKVL